MEEVKLWFLEEEEETANEDEVLEIKNLKILWIFIVVFVSLVCVLKWGHLL